MIDVEEHVRQIADAHVRGPFGWCRCGTTSTLTMREHAQHVSTMQDEARLRAAQRGAHDGSNQ